MSRLRTPWRAVAALFTLAGVLFGMWASRIPAVTERHQLEPDDLGLLLLVMAIGSTIAFPFAGRIADRVGSAVTARRFGVACSICLIAAGFAPTALTLAVALFFFGATLGSLDVSMNAWAAEVERARGRSIMSSFHAMFSVGAGAGALSGYLAISVGANLQVHFVVGAVIAVAAALWLTAISWESQRVGRGKGSPIYALPKGALIVVGLVAVGASIGEGGMADWSAIFLIEVADVSNAEATLGFTVFSVTMVATRLIGDRLVERFGPVLVGRVSGGFAVAGVSLAVAVGTFPTALIGFGLMGIGYAMIMPLAFTRAANDGTMPQGAAIASVATLGYGGVLFGPPLIGFVADATSIRTAFALLILFALLIVALSGVFGARRTDKT